MKQIPATVDSAIRLPLTAMPWRFRQAVVRAFEVDNPEFIQRRRMGSWTGGTDRKIGIARQTNGHMVVPRGGVRDLQRVAERYGVRVAFEDRRYPRTKPRTRPCWERVRSGLRDYQAAAAESALVNLQGLIVGPCGSGKTTIGAGIIACLDTPAIVLVHTRDLVDQWAERIETNLRLNVGIVGGGEHDLRPVTVATIQTLVQMADAELQDLALHFGLVIADECHHIPAMTVRKVLEYFPARYRVGLTATPGRADGLTSVIFWVLGDQIYTIEHGRLLQCGHLVAPKVLPIWTEFQFPPPEKEKDRNRWWNKLIDALTRDQARNEQICDIAWREYRAGHVILVLSGRVEHCGLLARLLNRRGCPAVAMTGKTAKKKRQQILGDMRAGVLRVLVASTVADEGLDLPILSRIVLAFPGAAPEQGGGGRAIQRLGRLMRPAPGKPQAVLYDLVDRRIPTLWRQWKQRKRAYEKAFGG